MCSLLNDSRTLRRLALSTFLSSLSLITFADSYSSDQSDNDIVANMEECYKQFLHDSQDELKSIRVVTAKSDDDTERRFLRSLDTNQPVTIKPTTKVTCADIFNELNDTFLAAIKDPDTPNFFPKPVYDFLSDSKTIVRVRQLLTGNTPVPTTSSSILSSVTSSYLTAETQSASTTTAVPSASPMAIAPTATGNTPDVPITFNDDQIKGFIANMAHFIITGMDTIYPGFCNNYFVDPGVEGLGCKALLVKHFLHYGNAHYFAWVESPDAMAEMQEWIKKYAQYSLEKLAVIAVFRTVELDSTLDIQQAALLAGIPDIPVGSFDPLAPLPPGAKPVIKTTGTFKSDCEKAYPQTLDAAYCSTLEANQTWQPNALIQGNTPLVSGVDFEATLKTVELKYTYQDGAGEQQDVVRNYPAVLVRSSSCCSAAAMLNSNVRLYQGGQTIIDVKSPLTLDTQVHPQPSAEFDYYIYSIVEIGEYVFSKNHIRVDNCSLLKPFYFNWDRRPYPQIVDGNVISDASGPCFSPTTASPTPTPTGDLLTASITTEDHSGSSAITAESTVLFTFLTLVALGLHF